MSKPHPLRHEFDSSWTCNYCGVPEEQKMTEVCPVRQKQALERAAEELRELHREDERTPRKNGKYRPRSFEVTATQLTVDMTEEEAEKLGVYSYRQLFRGTCVGFTHDLYCGTQTVHTSNWVVRDASGKLAVFTDEEFRAKFEPV